MKMNVTLTVALDIPTEEVVVVDRIYKELTDKLYVGKSHHPDDLFSVEAIYFVSVGNYK